MKFFRSYFYSAFLCFIFAFTTALAQEQVSSPSLSQGQILKIVMTIDKNEIAANKMAKDKSTNPKVQEVAGKMLSDHQMNLEQANALRQNLGVEAKSSDKSLTIEKDGKMLLSKLAPLSGYEFDKTYLKSMVAGHTEALHLIDTKLLPNAQNPKLISFLKATRTIVVHHLRMSKETLGQIR